MGGGVLKTLLIFWAFAVSVAMITFASCKSESDEDDTVAVESITISQTTATIAVGEELTLTVTVTPENATDKTVAWKTSDETKATVENGKVKGIAETENGETVTITASVGEKSATCEIAVIKLEAQDKSSVIMPSGKTLAENAFTDIDKTVVTIKKTSEGGDVKINITPKKANGTTTVTVKYDDKSSEVFAITITNGKVNVTKADQVATPEITCSNDNRVTITCATAGAEIFYTTDGSEPTSQSTKWTEAFFINDTITIKAIAIKAGMNRSSVGTAAFKFWTVTFDADGGKWGDDTTKTQNVRENGYAKAPENPKKTGMAFVHWYVSEDLSETKFDFATTAITNDVQLVAYWKEGIGVTSADIETIEFENGKTYVFDDTITQNDFNNVATKLKNATGISQANLDFSACKNITSIWYEAFLGCEGLKSIIIPDSITSIGEEAFAGCTSLTNIAIPDSVTNIGKRAFNDCKSLASVNIPDSVTSIEDYAFRSCTSLTSVVIPDGVTSIKQGAFSDCTSLTSVTIPNSVTSIEGSESYGYGAFSDCTGLTSITIPNSVTSIGDYAFCRCLKLTSITIPDGVTSIGAYTFKGCNSLTSITIPNSVTEIGEYAFNCCFGLSSITIPDSVTSIKNCAFLYCSRLSNITIPASVTSIGESVFTACNALTSITVAWAEGNKPADWYRYWNDGCNATIIYNGGN